MRARSVAAAFVAAAVASGAAAQTRPPKREAPPHQQLDALVGSAIRGELPPDGVAGPPPPTPSPTAGELKRIRDENERRAVLQGKRGPFAQAAAAFRGRDWYDFGWATLTLVTWAVGAAFGLWLLWKVVAAFRRH